MEAFDIIRAAMQEFSDIPDEQVRIYISLAEPMISKNKFGKLYPQALAYLSAHQMKVNGLGQSTVGGISIGDMSGYSAISISEGETSVSFASSQSSGSGSSADSEYSLTAYGRQFQQLQNRCIVPVVSAGMPNGC